MQDNKKIIEYTTEPLGQLSRIAVDIAEQKTKLTRTQTPEEYRHSQHLLAEVRPIPGHIKVLEETIAGVPCEWIEDSLFSIEERIIIYIHGGSWMFGDLESARPVAKMLVKETNFRVLVIGYRLAPEHPYPAGFEDCHTVYTHLLDTGYSPNQIGFFGDSAGGNYTLALMNRLKSEKIPLPACVGLASPATDLRDQSSLITSGDDLIYTTYEDEEQSIFQLYLGDEYINQRELPIISPITGELSGLPPILIHAGGAEPIADDNIAFANKVAKSGGEVFLKVWRDMFHDFTIVGPTLKESRESLREFGLFFQLNVKVK